MILPIIINNQQNKCPKCGKEESIIEVCSHCGYEYENEFTLFQSIMIILITILIISLITYIIVTLITWFVNVSDGVTLFDVLRSQLKWIRNIRIW